jgi:hypothetical protein
VLSNSLAQLLKPQQPLRLHLHTSETDDGSKNSLYQVLQLEDDLEFVHKCQPRSESFARQGLGADWCLGWAHKANYMNSDSLSTELSRSRNTRRENGSVFLQLSRQNQPNPPRRSLRFSSQMATAFAQHSDAGSVSSWRNCTFCQSTAQLNPMHFDLYSGKDRLNHRNRLDHAFTDSSLSFFLHAMRGEKP